MVSCRVSIQTQCHHSVQRFSRAGPRGRGREWATLGVHPLSWLLSNNRLEEVCSTLTKGTFSSRLLLSNQDKGCTPSVAHSLPLPLGPALLNLSSDKTLMQSFHMTIRIMCHERETLLKLNFFQLIKLHHSWYSILILIYRIDTYDLKNGNAHGRKRWKNTLLLNMNSAS